MNIKSWVKDNSKTVKIICVTFLGILAALTVALIPINLFCVNFPEWITVIMSTLFCIGLTGFLIFFKTKLVTKIVLPIVFGIIAIISSFLPYLIPYWNSYIFKNYNGAILNYDEVITYQAAQEDISALKHYLKRTHPMLRNGFTQEVENAFDLSLSRLKNTDSITVNDLRREIQTVLHLLGDAHTTTYNSYPKDAYLSAFPQKNTAGYAVTEINGKTVREIFEDAKYLYCYETEDWISIDLGSLATLDFLGYSEPFIYKWSNGENVIEETYTEKDFVGWNDFVKIRDQYYTPSQPKDFVYYTIDEQKNLAVLTLTECVYDQTYVDCVREMFSEIKGKNIKNVAVDLRGNGGGNSMVGNEFVKYLPVERYFDGAFDWRWGFITIHGNDAPIKNQRYKDLTFRGNVFILTDNASFSAAKDFAMLRQRFG